MRLIEENGSSRLEFDTTGTTMSGFEARQLLGIKDTVFITGHVYALTQEAFDAAMEKAAEMGYEETKPEADRPLPPYKFFSLKDIHAAQCGSCSSVISNKGVRCHNHKCECCGAVTYDEYHDGSAIKFYFQSEDEIVSRQPLSFKVFEYRENAGKPNELVLYAEPLTEEYTPPGSWSGLRQSFFEVTDPAQLAFIMQQAEKLGLFTREVVDHPQTGEKHRVIVIKDPAPHMLTPESVINTAEIAGQVHNFKGVKVYNGAVYGEWDALPVPEMFHLHNNYIGRKHSLSEPNIHEKIMSAAGQVSSADFYYQDGRDAFWDVEFHRMTVFVEHFVDVDPSEWAKFIYSSPKDGPGFIYALAHWCANMSDGKKRYVRNEPNIGNAMVTMGKLFSGEAPTALEMDAAKRGANSPEAQRLLGSLSEVAMQAAVVERALSDSIDRQVAELFAKPDDPTP